METLPMEVNLVAMGEKVRQRRKELGLKQDTLAEAVGITPQHLSNIENVKGKASLKVAVNLAYQLKIGLTELLADTVPPPEPIPDDLSENRDQLITILRELTKNTSEIDLVFYIDMVRANQKRNGQSHYLR